MLLDKRGKQLIKEFEGLKLQAYLDHVDVPTIGWGHTKGVRLGQKITIDEAEDLLDEDLKDALEGVEKYVTVPLSKAQHAALVSWTFNLGSGALKRSTMLEKINAKDYYGTLTEMVKWKNAGGRPARGLARRRHKEAALYCEDPWK